MRPEYQRDRDRILHSKAFRRLKHKTQVFLAPEGDHYRTRLTHTLEVSQIARTIAKTLRLNESLTEAIALGHDLGHTPFGHSGEYILNKICEDGFTHYEQSVRIVEVLEKDGRGLNLTWEVRDGIELPRVYTDVLGHSVRERLNNMIHDIILNSMDKPAITMSEGMEEAMQGLRKWMFDNVYKNDIPKAEEGKAQNMITQLYEYYMGHVDKLPVEYVLLMVNKGEKKSRVVCDYIAGMSDIYAIDQFEELFVPKRWNVY